MNSVAQTSHLPFLIVAGTSKAGTTSLFNYLAGHPQILPAVAKEARYFLDRDYPLKSSLRVEKDPLSSYLGFFHDQSAANGRWRLEATPDYLYSRDAARFIHQTLTNVRLVFLLREPISRLISFYRFGQQINRISRKTTFDEYVESQRTNPADEVATRCDHPAFSALQHGRYSSYLKPFLELMGRPALFVGFYEDLRADPEALVRSICRWAEVEEDFFRGYHFGITNKGVRMRSPALNRFFYQLKRASRSLMENQPVLRGMLRKVGGQMNSVYRKLNVAQRERVTMSPATNRFLDEYYAGEAGRLERMLEIQVPWAKNRTGTQQPQPGRFSAKMDGHCSL